MWVFWLRFRICLSVVFACSLFKKVFKTTRFHTFFAFLRPRHGPLVFRIRCSSLLFAFCKTLQKTKRFLTIFEFGLEPGACFLASKSHFWAFPEPTCGSKRLWELLRGVRSSKTHRKHRVLACFLRFCFRSLHGSFRSSGGFS